MANYVKFLRGTPNAYNNLQFKQEDTLYFIAEKDALTGKLYIGNTMVAGEMNEADLQIYLKNLNDVDVSKAKHHNVLSYDAQQQLWVPIDIDEISNITISELTAEINKKANIADVYTTTQVDNIISSIDILKIKKVNTIEEIDINANQYIYLVPSKEETNNNYEEYIIIEGQIEKLGSTSTPPGEVNIINSINEEEFEILKDDRKLVIKQVPIDKLSNLDKHETIQIIQKKIEKLSDNLNDFNGRLNKIETSIQTLQDNAVWSSL